MRWLKEAIKKDVIGVLILGFLLGAILIWSSGHFTDLHLTADGKLNSTLTWLTALAIFWYAYETYQLKKSTTDQVDIQKEIMLNEFLPILEPVAKAGSVIKNGVWQEVQLRNLGRGPAKYVTVQLQNVKIANNLSLAAGEVARVQIDRNATSALAAAIHETPDSLKMKVSYQDIYSRKFQTKNIILERVGRGRNYRLRQGAWDFWRTGKQNIGLASNKLI